MEIKTIAKYDSFNERRYSNPWVAICDSKCKPNFDKKVGEYTGGYGKGESGDLIVYEPVEGAVYMYGQKDNRKTQHSVREYVIFHHGQFWKHSKMECLIWISDEESRAAIIDADMSGEKE